MTKNNFFIFYSERKIVFEVKMVFGFIVRSWTAKGPEIYGKPVLISF